ncbi:MAG: hypothetical protein ACRCTS_06925 [Fusobacteriaceae bacterium]
MNHKYKEIEKNIFNLILLTGIIILVIMFWGVNSGNVKFLVTVSQ